MLHTNQRNRNQREKQKRKTKAQKSKQKSKELFCVVLFSWKRENQSMTTLKANCIDSTQLHGTALHLHGIPYD
jgi:hypothetical protein